MNIVAITYRDEYVKSLPRDVARHFGGHIFWVVVVL